MMKSAEPVEVSDGNTSLARPSSRDLQRKYLSDDRRVYDINGKLLSNTPVRGAAAQKALLGRLRQITVLGTGASK